MRFLAEADSSSHVGRKPSFGVFTVGNFNSAIVDLGHPLALFKAPADFRRHPQERQLLSDAPGRSSLRAWTRKIQGISHHAALVHPPFATTRRALAFGIPPSRRQPTKPRTTLHPLCNHGFQDFNVRSQGRMHSSRPGRSPPLSGPVFPPQVRPDNNQMRFGQPKYHSQGASPFRYDAEDILSKCENLVAHTFTAANTSHPIAQTLSFPKAMKVIPRSVRRMIRFTLIAGPLARSPPSRRNGLPMRSRKTMFSHFTFTQRPYFRPETTRVPFSFRFGVGVSYQNVGFPLSLMNLTSPPTSA